MSLPVFPASGTCKEQKGCLGFNPRGGTNVRSFVRFLLERAGGLNSSADPASNPPLTEVKAVMGHRGLCLET
jgi:hypothetical protein